MRFIPLFVAWLGSLLLASPVLAQADQIWELTDEATWQNELGALTLPAAIAHRQAVIGSLQNAEELRVGQEIGLTLAPGHNIVLTLSSTNVFSNGDANFSGSNTAGDHLVLTRSANSVRGTLYSDGIKYQLISTPVANDNRYVGWLYFYPDDLILKPHDLPETAFRKAAPIQEFSGIAALSGEDVSIEQTPSSDRVSIGDEVQFDVSITNNLATTISNETVNVLFILDDSELVSLDNDCSSTVVSGYASIQCTILKLSPGASYTFSYTVRLTDSAYPYAVGSVFVGDIFSSSNNVQNNKFIFGLQDTLVDSDNDGISDFNEAITRTDPLNASSSVGSDYISEIDLMFLYTNRYADELGSLTAETEINHMVATVNSYYLNSDVQVRFRPVYYAEINYDFGNNLDTPFYALQQSEGIFSNTFALRDDIGADIVVVMDGIVGEDGSCGVGSLPGRGFKGDMFHPNGYASDLIVAMYGPGFGSSGGCDELTLAHELGHNLGIAHSRRDPGSEGAFGWAHGYGVDGSFATIMAYASRFPGAQEVPLFSNPLRNDCNGQACGISRGDLEPGADAVHVINHTRFQVAALRSPRILSVASLDQSASNLIMYGAASSNGVDRTSFAASDSIDVRATLKIPSEHVQRGGEVYIVISVPGAGFFYVDEQGAYQAWNGEASTLGSRIGTRPLQETEELVAFNEFVPADYGVSGLGVQVFFAYSVSNTDVFVYSSEGISFTIQ